MGSSVKNFADNVKIHSNYFQETIDTCRSILYNHPIASKALNYLNSRVSKTNQKKFEFGYFPEDIYIDALTSKVDREKLYELKLLYKWYIPDGITTTILDRGSLSNHNLIMPYKDSYGNIVALVGRSLLNDEDRKALDYPIPKYKNTAFIKSVQLFGLNHAKQSIIKNNSVIIVEGQIDAITAHEYGYHNVVALGGVAFSHFQFYMLRRFTNNFYLLLDNDDEGINSSNKIINKYGKFANIKRITIPNDFKDLDETLHNSPVDPFNEQFI